MNCPAPYGCDGLADPNDRLACENAYACFANPANHCVSMGDPVKCWCGANLTTCATSNAAPTQANGPCLQQVFAAAKTMDAPTIKLRFIDNTFPLGLAVNLSLCRGSFCGAGSADDGVSSLCAPF